jgi:hypothetical protein
MPRFYFCLLFIRHACCAQSRKSHHRYLPGGRLFYDPDLGPSLAKVGVYFFGVCVVWCGEHQPYAAACAVCECLGFLSFYTVVLLLGFPFAFFVCAADERCSAGQGMCEPMRDTALFCSGKER